MEPQYRHYWQLSNVPGIHSRLVVFVGKLSWLANVILVMGVIYLSIIFTLQAMFFVPLRFNLTYLCHISYYLILTALYRTGSDRNCADTDIEERRISQCEDSRGPRCTLSLVARSGLSGQGHKISSLENWAKGRISLITLGLAIATIIRKTNSS